LVAQALGTFHVGTRHFKLANSEGIGKKGDFTSKATPLVPPMAHTVG